MGAVLRWLFPLISALLGLSRLPRATSYHEETSPYFHAHGLDKRWVDDGRAWNCLQCSRDNGFSFASLEEEFREVATDAAKNLRGPLLLHIGSENGDELIYWNDADNISSARECVDAPFYRNFKVLSHLPVEVALSSYNGTLWKDTVRLRTAADLLNVSLNDSSMWGNKADTAQELLDRVYERLDNNDNSTFKTAFLPSLRVIARAAVTDYLENLHRTVQNLSVSLDETFKKTIIVIYHKFAYNNSYIVQYYNRLSIHKPRIILQPLLSVDDNCSSNSSCSALEMATFSVHALSLDRKVGEIFLEMTTSAHDDFLDSEAKQIICSTGNFSGHDFDCPDDLSPLRGFRTPEEKAYVVLFVFFCALSVVLGIFLLAICYEDRVIKAESSPLFRRKTIERDRTLSGLSEKSNDE